MRILALSDMESPYIYDHFNPEAFKDVSLVLCAGDLKADYMSFIATMLSVPVLYVHGNHDETFLTNPPEGCINIDGTVYNHHGVRIFGMGGCMTYSGGPLQFTEFQMTLKMFKKKFQLRKGCQIFLTHSPALGLGDGQDRAHTGYRCFLDFLEKVQPKWMIHGHQHLNYGNAKRVNQYLNTNIVNAFGYTFIDYV